MWPSNSLPSLPIHVRPSHVALGTTLSNAVYSMSGPVPFVDIHTYMQQRTYVIDYITQDFATYVPNNYELTIKKLVHINVLAPIPENRDDVLRCFTIIQSYEIANRNTSK